MTCMVTGSTGLLGSAIVRKLAQRGDAVIAAARNVEKARRMFGGLPGVSAVAWDVTRPFDAAALPGSVDSIVHAAAETASRNMVERPVETMAVTLDGTRNALELARAHHARGRPREHRLRGPHPRGRGRGLCGRHHERGSRRHSRRRGDHRAEPLR